MKNIKWSAIFISFAYITGGVLFFMFHYSSIVQLCTFVGYAGLILGLYNIIAYLVRSKQKSLFKNDFMMGLLLITIAVIMLIYPNYFVDLVYVILALVIMLSGYSKLQDGVDSLRFGGKNGFTYVLLALISIIIGIVVIIEGAYMNIDTLDVIVGVGLIYSGVTDFITSLILSIRMIKDDRQNKKQVEETEEIQEEIQEDEPKEDEILVDDQNNNAEN